MGKKEEVEFIFTGPGAKDFVRMMGLKPKTKSVQKSKRCPKAGRSARKG